MPILCNRSRVDDPAPSVSSLIEVPSLDLEEA